MKSRATCTPSRMIAALVFTICAFGTASASKETTLHSFTPYQHGNQPYAMTSDAVGNLFVTSGGGRYNAGMILKFTHNSHGGLAETALYNFKGGSDGKNPLSLVLDSAGNLYGETTFGGAFNAGTFFKMTPTAAGDWNESVLYSFPDFSNGFLDGGLVADTSGNFYGTTDNQGPTYGTVFQLTQDAHGWTRNVLHTFTGGADGGRPFGKLVLDHTGNLYGTAVQGGVADDGIVFELTPASGGSWSEKVLYNFVGGADGSRPGGGVTFDAAGNLYGTTSLGGSTAGCGGTGGCGTVFELRAGSGGTWAESIIYTFHNGTPDAVYPGGLAIDNSGNLYGTALQGLDGYCCGFVFELFPTSGGQWSGVNLYTFPITGGENPYYPNSDLVVGAAGQVYGTTTLGGAAGVNGTLFELSAGHGPRTLANVYGFPLTDGANPYAGIIADASGNLYGTTNAGGIENFGTVFRLSPGGQGNRKENTLYNFPSGQASLNEGALPSSLILDAAGNLYGSAGYSGTRQTGSVVEVTAARIGKWEEKNLIQFGGQLDHPLGDLVRDQAGNLYGTTMDGGDAGAGAIFELSPQADGTWLLTTLYSFIGYPWDGSHPRAGLIFDSAGNLYGTTQKGGDSANCVSTSNQPLGCGTVFELQPTKDGGWKEQMLYSFAGSTADGAAPSGKLVLDKNGNLLGTTASGGIKSPDCHIYLYPPGCGIVFELSLNGATWTETILHQFSNSNGDGFNPRAGLLMDPEGNLYGTTSGGGDSSFGTVFEFAPATGGGWTETILHSFNGIDGQLPMSALIRDGKGNLYGTAAAGGYAGYGTVFMITP